MIRITEIEKDFREKNNISDLLEDCYYSNILPTAEWGEGMIPTKVSSNIDMIDKFGYVTKDNYRDYHQTLYFLKYSNKAKPIRVVNRNGFNKQNNYIDNNPPINSEIPNFYNSSIADVDEITTGRMGIVERYLNINEDISISICSSLSSWDKEISYEKLNIVISKTTTEPPENPQNNDMYLLPINSTGDWLGHDGQYAIWLIDNDAWNFVSVLSNDAIFVKDEGVEYIRDGGLWVEQEDYYKNLEYVKFKNESAYRKVYDEPYQNVFGRVIKFNQMVLQRPDFENGDFILLIFKKNKITNRFSLVERYITNYDTAEDDINFKSKYIYIKINDTSSEKIDTKNYSIIESRLRHNTNTNLLNTEADFIEAVNILCEDDEVKVISDIEYNDEMNLVSGRLKDNGSDKILVSGCYNSIRYTGFDTILADFSRFRDGGYCNTTHYDKSFIISSMVLETEDRKYIPLFGEVVGYVFRNLSDGNFINAGRRNKLLLNSKLLLNANETNLSLLHHNFINNVVWDKDLKAFFVSNDVMLDMSATIGYALVFDNIKYYITSFFDNYSLGCGRITELEKLKNIMIKKIKKFGVDSNVSYTIIVNDDGLKRISFLVGLEYKSVIKEIIVNIIIR